MIKDKQSPKCPNVEPQEVVKPVVFYDGLCPLCSREIAHYRRLRGSDTMHWIDIAQDETSLAEYGLRREAAMARFHVLDVARHWQTGAWGFAELWSHLPAYRWLARALRALRLLPVLDWVYAGFARWRIRRSCNSQRCVIDKADARKYPVVVSETSANRGPDS